MTEHTHILEDGRLDKLDLEVKYSDPAKIKSIYPDSLRVMEPPSVVAPISAQSVYDSLVAHSKVARKQLEEAKAKCPARVNQGPTSAFDPNVTVEEHAQDLMDFVLAEAVEKNRTVPGEIVGFDLTDSYLMIRLPREAMPGRFIGQKVKVTF